MKLSEKDDKQYNKNKNNKQRVKVVSNFKIGINCQLFRSKANHFRK